MTNPSDSEKVFALLAKLPGVYLPPSLRTGSTPQDASPDDEDQLARIANADPVGFLLAIMSGESVMSFTVKPLVEEKPDTKRRRGRPKKQTATAQIKIAEESDYAVYTTFHSPSVADRQRVAAFLAKFVARNSGQTEEQSEDDEFNLLCEKRAAQAAAAALTSNHN